MIPGIPDYRTKIQFITGMVVWPNDTLIVTYGERDCETKVATFRLSKTLELARQHSVTYTTEQKVQEIFAPMTGVNLNGQTSYAVAYPYFIDDDNVETTNYCKHMCW